MSAIGRPRRDKGVASIRLTIRLSAHEKRRWIRALAKCEESALSEWVRNACEQRIIRDAEEKS